MTEYNCSKNNYFFEVVYSGNGKVDEVDIELEQCDLAHDVVHRPQNLSDFDEKYKKYSYDDKPCTCNRNLKIIILMLYKISANNYLSQIYPEEFTC